VKAIDMIKKMIAKKLISMSLTAILLSGCTFIVKDDHAVKYYGIDEQRGSEYLNQILEKQQEVYRAEKSPADTKKP